MLEPMRITYPYALPSGAPFVGGLVSSPAKFITQIDCKKEEHASRMKKRKEKDDSASVEPKIQTLYDEA